LFVSEKLLLHAPEIREPELHAAKNNSGRYVAQEKEDEIIDLPLYPREGETNLREAFLHPCQGQEYRPERGRGKAKFVEEKVSKNVIAFLVASLVTLLVSKVKRFHRKAAHFFHLGVQPVQMSLVNPENQGNRHFPYHDGDESQKKGAEEIVKERIPGDPVKANQERISDFVNDHHKNMARSVNFKARKPQVPARLRYH
jgi:hypothetical protein